MIVKEEVALDELTKLVEGILVRLGKIESKLDHFGLYDDLSFSSLQDITDEISTINKEVNFLLDK